MATQTATPTLTPTPIAERSHTFKTRTVPNPDAATAKRTPELEQIRPTQTGRTRYGIRDLGWSPREAYLTQRGTIRKGATA